MTDGFDLDGTLCEVCLEPIAIASPTATVEECARLLAGHVSAVVVDDAPPRVVTESVRAVATQAGAETEISEIAAEAPVVMPQSMRTASAMQCLLAGPATCVIVQRADGALLGRLTLYETLRAVLPRPAWVRALQFALHIEHTATWEMEQ
jgi:hypothetical protein